MKPETLAIDTGIVGRVNVPVQISEEGRRNRMERDKVFWGIKLAKHK